MQAEAPVAGRDLDLLAAHLADRRRAELLQGTALAADQEPTAALSEQGLLGGAAPLSQRLDIDAAADRAADRRLGQGGGQAAVADVVRRGKPPFADRLADRGARRGNGGD